MRLLKPDWVSLDGKPIFSIDIHPDGSRFATGGQGDNSGKVVIWNMAPVKSETAEKNDNVPKMLCQMDNHFGCVNCVRWSGNGRNLASGGDDKLIMIWQTSRHAGVSSTFGSAGGVVNVEQWRVGSTLRGHTGDVLDLAWSPNDIWLASCSVDNTVIVWNAQKFPEQVSVLRGHSSLVKGVTWDPVGKYLASQSDDKTLRIWRTLDWQQDICVEEPFKECGGTTHVLRLSWSPDGQYVVSAHAMNNSGPTAQIVERDGWQTNMDFVGHRKAITVVRFNPCILSKKIKETALKPQNFTCCAIGSKDRSISIWLTALKRPLVVTHDLFTSTVLDASWSQSGMELLVCSWDGTVAYLNFDKEEIGRPLSSAEKMELHKSLYGKTALSAGGVGLGTQIVESADLFDIQKPKTKQPEVKPVPAPKDRSGSDNNNIKQAMANGDSSCHMPTKIPMPHPSNSKQIETRTRDGRRRITPIFLAPQPEFGEAPLPFNSNSNEPQFSSSKEQSTIVIEKKDSTSSPSTPVRPTHASTNASPIVGDSPSRQPPPEPLPTTPKSNVSAGALDCNVKLGTPTHKSSMKTVEQAMSSQSTPNIPTDRLTDSDAPDKDRLKLSLKRKAELSGGHPLKRGPGRPRKDRNQDIMAIPIATTPVSVPQLPVLAEQTCVVYAASGLNLPTPCIDKSVTLQICGAVGSDSSISVEIDNSVTMPGVGTLHRVCCMKQGQVSWECLRSSKIIACAGNSHVVCVSCEDNSVTVYNAQSGRTLYPSMVLDSRLSVLQCSGYYLMAITSRGNLFVWDTKNLTVLIKNESLVTIITSPSVKLERSLLTDQGIPVLTISTGRTYTYKMELGCWVLLGDRNDMLHMCSDYQSSLPPNLNNKHGPLAIIQASTQRPGSQARLLNGADPSLKHSATLSHLESQLSCALVLKSGQEYHLWMLTYVHYLVQEGIEDKLRDVCSDLLGPTYKSKSATKWTNSILGLNKRDLLLEILPIIASNLKLQRLYTEYQEQLEAVKGGT